MDIKILSQNIVNNPKDFTAEKIEQLFEQHAKDCLNNSEKYFRIVLDFISTFCDVDSNYNDDELVEKWLENNTKL